MTISHIGNNIYLGVSGDTKPTNVPTGSIFITTDTRRFYVWDGDSWEESAYATPGGADERAIVKEAGSAVGAGLGRKINFVQSNDFDITEDTGNDEYDIQIASNAIGDSHIVAHTTTKITIADKTKLPATTVFTDQSNTFTSSNVYQASNTFAVEQKHNRIAATPADPDPDTGFTYLLELDANNDVFASKNKIGGTMVEVRDF